MSNSPFAKNRKWYSARGQVEYKNIWYDYSASWAEEDVLIGGIDTCHEGWDTEVDDDTWRWSVEGGTGDLTAKEVGELEMIVWDDAMRNRVEDKDEDGEDGE